MLRFVRDIWRSFFPVKEVVQLRDPFEGFNKNKILPDSSFPHSKLDIQSFLESQGSFLSCHRSFDVPFSSFLDTYAYQHNINPRFILALIETSDHLISTPVSPSVESLEKAIYLIPHARGLENQIIMLMRNLRRYFDLYNLKSSGKVHCVDDDSVIAENALTYTFYFSCPYVGMYDLYKVTSVKDGNNIVGKETRLWIKAPFGAFKFYKTINSLFVDKGLLGDE